MAEPSSKGKDIDESKSGAIVNETGDDPIQPKLVAVEFQRYRRDGQVNGVAHKRSNEGCKHNYGLCDPDQAPIFVPPELPPNRMLIHA